MRSKYFDGSLSERRGAFTIGLVTLAAALLVVVPQNYVALSPIWKAATQLATVVGGAAALGVVFRRNRRVAMILLTAALFFAIVDVLQHGDGWGAAYMMAPFAVGYAASPRRTGNATVRGILWVALLIILLTVLVDALTGGASVAGWFGDAYRVTDMTETRPRGLLGQPVPTAVATAVITIVVVRQAASIANGAVRRTTSVLAVVLGASAIIYTGTRSALILLALGLIINLLRPASKAHGSNALISWMAFALLAAVSLWSWPRYMSSLSHLRAFSFESILGTESVVNRQYALTILDSWVSNCSIQCKLLGSGPRDLQHQLLNFIGYNGLTTVDNLYVTVLWDFGVVGLVIVALPGLVAVRHLLVPRAVVTPGSLAVLVIYISGFFFDVLYTVPFVVMLGFFAALVGSESGERRRDGTAAKMPESQVLGGLR
jgi:hypothetical protein